MTSAIINKAFCRDCGDTISANAFACPKCGASQRVGSVSGEKNRMTAILLALFLGGFGVHKFYLGQSVMGIFYLLFFWTFIPAIIAFIEMIIYILQSDEEFAEKYNGRV